MGRSGSGKTSMRSIIFANYLARDTKHMSYTGAWPSQSQHPCVETKMTTKCVCVRSNSGRGQLVCAAARQSDAQPVGLRWAGHVHGRVLFVATHWQHTSQRLLLRPHSNEEETVNTKKDRIFKDVQVLIYLFDIETKEHAVCCCCFTDCTQHTHSRTLCHHWDVRWEAGNRKT